MVNTLANVLAEPTTDSHHELHVQVCYADPNREILYDLIVKPGTMLRDAIMQSGVIQTIPEIDLAVNRVGIYGKVKALETVLNDYDRIEIYRPLIADPKESRRRRAEKKADGKIREATRNQGRI